MQPHESGISLRRDGQEARRRAVDFDDRSLDALYHLNHHRRIHVAHVGQRVDGVDVDVVLLARGGDVTQDEPAIER